MACWVHRLGLVLAGSLGACGSEADDRPGGTAETIDTSIGSSSEGGTDGSSTAGTTGPVTCGAGQTDCFGACVDLDNDPDNCGGCGTTCVIPNAAGACVGGSCALGACDAGWADCDGNGLNGCELAVQCDAMAACTTSCQSEGTMDCGNVCAPLCAPPVESCNVVDDNCDGNCDEGAIAGCRIGVHRSRSAALGHFYTTDAAEAQAGDLILEALDFYHLYEAAAPGLQPFFRCLKANGKRLYTTQTDCEMQGSVESTIGFIAPDVRCGSVPLYRSLNAPADAHFYTHSLTEHDNAVQTLGFVDQGIAGYVWTVP